MTHPRVAIYLTLLLALGARSAAAQPGVDDEPIPRATANPAPPVPDATLNALRGRVIEVRQPSGSCVVGELLGFDGASVTLSLATTRDVVTLPRAEVAGLRLAEPAVASPAHPPHASTSDSALVASGPLPQRHFGLQLGLAPALMLDYEAGLFYGFVNAAVVLPMASSGDLLGFAVGAGVSLPLSTGSRWRLDIFAHLTPVRFGRSDVNVGGGVGLGVHFTARNGFTLGFKSPILGYSGFTGDNHSNDAATGVAYYYLGGVMGLPVISLGYRF